MPLKFCLGTEKPASGTTDGESGGPLAHSRDKAPIGFRSTLALLSSKSYIIVFVGYVCAKENDKVVT